MTDFTPINTFTTIKIHLESFSFRASDNYKNKTKLVINITRGGNTSFMDSVWVLCFGIGEVQFILISYFRMYNAIETGVNTVLFDNYKS